MVSKLQDERFNLVFVTLSDKDGANYDSNKKQDFFSRTDRALNDLIPWRDEIPLKVFSSRVRFQIRIDDLRESVDTGNAKIDDILDFYNSVTDALLTLYTKEVRVIKGSKTWKTVVVYKNILRAIDNIGINAAYVIKYYLKGALPDDEMIQYLKSQVLSQEYLTQASNFSPFVRGKVMAIKTDVNYKKLFEMYDFY